MTRAEATAWRERWRLVNEFQRNELLRMTPDEKLEQLDVLLEAAEDFGWIEKLDRDEARVRDVWMRLRRSGRG